MKKLFIILALLAVSSHSAFAADEQFKEGRLPACAYGTSVSDIGLGYSSTSVNNAVFRTNSLVTNGDHQYSAYYDQDGNLVLASRRLPDGDWTTKVTQYKGNVADAHNVISIGVDGDGYIHVAFDHHGHPLKYCKSTAPGKLELGALTAMVGTDEADVTYPEFHNLAGGDLLFAYRSGASGRGNLVINRYDKTSKKWSRVHDKLIDGEGQRNAYWQMCTDANGTLHLSWVWRETWMVETNHDMCYARSTDGGLTWQRADGTPQPLPITKDNAEYAARIPQSSELINQTSMTADSKGNPYIVTYWRADGEAVPQYRIVWHDDKGWHNRPIGERTAPFSLAGGGTKMIPISRPQIVADGDRAYCIYRDAERGSRVSVASTQSLSKGQWAVADITDYGVDAWEPTIDASRWAKDGVLSIFVQECHQGDGEKTVPSEPTMVRVIDVNPDVVQVLGIIDRVNTHWQKSNPKHGRAFWDNAAYHTGNMEAYRLTGEKRYLDYSKAWAEHNQWKGAKGDDRSRWKYDYGEDDDHVLFGDYQICFQTYADIYNLEGDENMVARAREVMEYQMSTPQNDYWWWADGLYMVMPVMTKMYHITGNSLYLDKLHEYWSFADNLMFDTDEHLYYRDGKYIYPKHESVNGHKDFWARGDGWVCAGLAKVIADMPDDRAEKSQYIERYRQMMAAVKGCQQSEGYWTRSLLDPEHAPGPETSGTAFFTYALLWGINNGVLNHDEYIDTALRGWQYLTGTALQPDGSVGYVQPIGEKAIPGQVVNARSSHNFGTGAFLLAACEMARYLNR